MPIKIYKRGDIWHYRGTVAGRRVRGSTGTSDKATAQRIANAKESRAWTGHLDGPAAVLTFAQAAILYRQSGKSDRFLEKVEDHWKEALVKDITAGAIRKSALKLYPKASAATRNRQVIVPTQAIINHAADSDLCPPIRVKRFPVVKKEKEPATWEWVQAFMVHANPHIAALACFMFLTGARVSEALDVRWEDVDLTRRRAMIRQTKVGSERWAHMPQPLLVAIANIPSNREPNERVFRYAERSIARQPWNRAIEQAGIKPLSFHSCRHGFATSMLQAGVDPVTVAKRGGWASVQHLFATYGHAMDDETVTDRIIGTPQTQPVSAEKKDDAKSVG